MKSFFDYNLYLVYRSMHRKRGPNKDICERSVGVLCIVYSGWVICLIQIANHAFIHVPLSKRGVLVAVPLYFTLSFLLSRYYIKGKRCKEILEHLGLNRAPMW